MWPLASKRYPNLGSVFRQSRTSQNNPLAPLHPNTSHSECTSFHPEGQLIRGPPSAPSHVEDVWSRQTPAARQTPRYGGGPGETSATYPKDRVPQGLLYREQKSWTATHRRRTTQRRHTTVCLRCVAGHEPPQTSRYLFHVVVHEPTKAMWYI